MVPTLLSILALSTPEALASGALGPQHICIDIDTDFADDGPAGDYWQYSAPRPASGVKMEIIDASGSVRSAYADANGCATLYIDTSGPLDIFVDSEGKISGVTLESYVETSSGVVFATHSEINHPYSTSTINVLIPKGGAQSSAWHYYALGAYAMSRSTMGIGAHGNTSFCHGLESPGSSTVPCCGYDEWSATHLEPRPGGQVWEHGTIDDHTLVFIQKESGNPCCGSNWNDSYGDWGVPTGSRSFVVIPAVEAIAKLKFQVAHELGHVIVMKRMGLRTEENYKSELYACMGSWKTNGNGRADAGGGVGEKSLLTREYSSAAAREGWAHFYSAWLFNDPTQSDCQFQPYYTLQDFDLDGTVSVSGGAVVMDSDDLDNIGYSNPDEDGIFSCEGGGIEPSLGEPDTADPLAGYVYARDWLKHSYQNAPNCPTYATPVPVCADGLYIPSSSTTHGCTAEYFGRSTQYDWMRYFWDLASDEGIPAWELADVYVDMCPTDWVAASQGKVADQNWPEVRLERSMNFHGYSAEHNRQKDNGVAHFQ